MINYSFIFFDVFNFLVLFLVKILFYHYLLVIFIDPILPTVRYFFLFIH